MTQNNEPKAKPEDAAEPTKPEPDQEEIESLDVNLTIQSSRTILSGKSCFMSLRLFEITFIT